MADGARAALLEWVADLGSRVDQRWRAVNYSRDDLPEIAATELGSRPAHQEFGFDGIVDYLFNGNCAFQENFDSQFGEPPLTLYWHPLFYIEALHWASATPAIHNHSFHGAFTVLQGSSLQTTYHFECQRRYSESFSLGALRIVRSELLKAGAIQQILPQDRFIHSVFHLDSPSVTLVVRTHSARTSTARFAYLPPAVAYDPTVEHQQRARKLQMLSLMRRIKADRYLELTARTIESEDALTSFLALQQAIAGSRGLLQSLQPSALRKFGDVSDRILETALEAKRRGDGNQLRARLTSPELRLILGVVLASSNRDQLLFGLRAIESGLNLGDLLVGLLRALSRMQLVTLADNPDTLRQAAAALESGRVADLAISTALERSELLRPFFVTD